MSPARVYLDNAATSFPKPPCVAEAMARYAADIGVAPGRGAYAESIRATGVVNGARRSIARLLNAPAGSGADPAARIVFTLNCTDALNLAIKGVVRHASRSGVLTPHVVTTEAEHNSILRPLRALESAGECRVTRIACSGATGRIDPDDVRRAIRDAAGAVLFVTHHASNVTGALQPIDAIGAICRDMDVPLLLDAAQTLGHAPIDAPALGAALIAFPGHKGLYGPLGTGGLYIAPGMEHRIEPLREGGTGSRSELDTQPGDLPDRFEAGSQNGVGLAGLGAGVEWVLEHTVETLAAQGRELSRQFLEGLDGSSLRVLGHRDVDERVPVFALEVAGIPPHDAAAVLETEFGLLTRAGLHCSPGVHCALGTSPDGAVRVSFGAFNTAEHARAAASALREIAAEAGASR